MITVFEKWTFKGNTKELSMENEYSILSYGRIYNPRNWFYNPAYLVNRIYYIIRGTAYYREQIPLKPGYLYIFRASPYFQVCQKENDPVDHAYIDFVTYRRLLETDYIEIDPGSSPKLFNLLNAMKEDFCETLSFKTAGAYLEILIHYLKEYLASDVTYSETTSAVLRLFHSRPVVELSVSQIAAELNKDASYIIRCFKSETGMTPHKYLAQLKTDLAISYARQGMNSTEIAEKLGFSSLSAFSYFFKSETHKNLSEFR